MLTCKPRLKQVAELPFTESRIELQKAKLTQCFTSVSLPAWFSRIRRFLSPTDRVLLSRMDLGGTKGFAQGLSALH